MKNLTLLRKLSEPKVGDLVTSVDSEVTYMIEAVVKNTLCVSTVKPGEPEVFVCKPYLFRQNPVCWVEGTPIYKGDTVYAIALSDGTVHDVIVDRFLSDMILDKDTTIIAPISCVSLSKPVVKKTAWVNVYSNGSAYLHDSKEAASSYAAAGLHGAKTVLMSWEE